jgi:hypothetical protein
MGIQCEIVWVDAMGDFFAPASTDMVTAMVAQYNQARERIKQVVEFANGEACEGVIGYFLEGNATEDRGRISMQTSAHQLFQEDGAVASLNSAYWSKALALTDVYDAMPQDRRNQWNTQIRNPRGVKKHRGADSEWETPPLPDFEEETVRATLQGLLASRAKFLAERVDGIFRALSGEHVTNSPAAFSKRMIIARLISSYDTINHDRVGYINDLRCVVAKFMGRDEPQWNSTSSVVDRARRQCRGQWVTLDGGSLRLRAYKCGTAHLEVHPDMAWRLNCVLAQLHPMAIPSEFRQKPKKQPRDFVMMGRPLPFSVVETLNSLETAVNLVENTGPEAWHSKYRRVEIKNALQFRYVSKSSDGAIAEAERVLFYIGGVKAKNDRGGAYYEFDYDPREVIAEIVCTGCLPDQKAHQYYPTPENVAKVAIDLAKIEPEHNCLEPSAGTGGLADMMPLEQTLCVEISALHCKILEAKMHRVVQADFLKMESGNKFDRIVMNPPFSEGRWQAHLEHAAGMLVKNGRLVAILPASAKGKDVLPGWSCQWSSVFENEFAGTSVNVAILVAEPKA